LRIRVVATGAAWGEVLDVEQVADQGTVLHDGRLNCPLLAWARRLASQMSSARR
jgi:hypothetical protein